ncbi:MAG: metallophosphoesterase family protein [Planctomycetota bacterium]|jgi:hypothetical protein
MRGFGALLLLAALPGCGGSSSSGQLSFAFVVIADPHVFDSAAADRLQACVDWINSNRDTDSIELVFVAGDLGRPASARPVLDGLDVPYLPVIGDNVIQGGTENDFDVTFAPHYSSLVGVLDGFARQPTPVSNPDIGGQSHLQNFSFDHRGVRFVCLDWCTRTIGGPASESADLHDFSGGTWPWFEDEIRAGSVGPRERIVMVSHHPMHDLVGGYGAFNPAEMGRVEALTGLHGDWVYANFAGHYHFDWEETRSAGGYRAIITDATWDDENTFRLVRVFESSDSFSYETEIIVLP